MNLPRPDALRLWTRAGGVTPPKPPFGLRGWSPSADAIAVLLEKGPDGNGVAAVAAQLPPASTLPSGTLLLVLGVAVARRGLWALFAPKLDVLRAARCSALLIRGYAEIGAGVDAVTGADLAWGSAP